MARNESKIGDAQSSVGFRVLGNLWLLVMTTINMKNGHKQEWVSMAFYEPPLMEALDLGSHIILCAWGPLFIPIEGTKAWEAWASHQDTGLVLTLVEFPGLLHAP